MKSNKEIKQEIIEKVIQYIEEKKYLPWDKGILNEFNPINPLTGTQYKGFNKWLLNFISGDSTQEYATFNQIKANKGKVKKDSKGMPIIYYNWKKWNKKEQRPWKAGDNEEDLKEIPFLQKYTVFALDDVEGIEKTRQIKKSKDNPKIDEADNAIESFINATSLEVKYRNGTGLYSPSAHQIHITPIEGYKSSERYYKTFFHEIIHSTGKALGRKNCNSFASKEYSEEEIVAEFGAMMLCSHFNIQAPIENTAEYLRRWSELLRANPDWLINGAKQAEKAVEYFLKKIKEYGAPVEKAA